MHGNWKESVKSKDIYTIETVYIFLLIRFKQSKSIVNTLSLKFIAKVIDKTTPVQTIGEEKQTKEDP